MKPMLWEDFCIDDERYFPACCAISVLTNFPLNSDAPHYDLKRSIRLILSGHTVKEDEKIQNLLKERDSLLYSKSERLENRIDKIETEIAQLGFPIDGGPMFEEGPCVLVALNDQQDGEYTRAALRANGFKQVGKRFKGNGTAFISLWITLAKGTKTLPSFAAEQKRAKKDAKKR